MFLAKKHFKTRLIEKREDDLYDRQNREKI